MKTLSQIESTGDVTSQIIHASTLLEADLLYHESASAEPLTLRERVKDCPTFVRHGLIQEIFRALDVRNAIAHLSDDAQPTEEAKTRAVQQLVQAINVLRQEMQENADDDAVMSQIDAPEAPSVFKFRLTVAAVWIMMLGACLLMSIDLSAKNSIRASRIAESPLDRWQFENDPLETMFSYVCIGMWVTLSTSAAFLSRKMYLDFQKDVAKAAGGIDVRVVRAVAFLEVELRRNAPESRLTVGELTQRNSVLSNQANHFIRDVNFALGVRNRIVHYSVDQDDLPLEEPSHEEKLRAIEYLTRAVQILNSVPGRKLPQSSP